MTGNTKYSYFGGVIGYVAPFDSQSVSISNSAIGLGFTRSTNTSRASIFGSAIARIENKEYVKDSRTVTLDTVDVDITASGPAVTKFGGILGTDWLSADVTLSGVTVSNADITATTNSTDFGGLVQTATGRWDVQSIALTQNKAKFAVPSGGTFGFIANKTSSTEFSANTALYLDVVDANYNIGYLTFTGAPGFTVYDEIVADSRYNGTNITNNGNSVISITTSGNVINTSGSSNTYKNKTAYGEANNSINQYTRYYYNIAYARANTATPKYNFLTWTVGQYAHSTLADWFTATPTFTGDLDMTGLSYYPIDLTTDVTFNLTPTVKLDNKLMETWVKATDSDSNTRSTRANDNQH